MSDLIDRQAAIEAMMKLQTEDIEAYGASIPEGFDGDRAVTALKALPSATDTNVGGNLIDRQAALDAIKKLEKPAPTAQHLSAIFDCEDTIEALPPAQPECEDAVSRFEVLRLIDYSSHDLNDAVDNRYMQNEIKQLPSVTPKQRTDLLKAEIKRMKRSFTTCINSDYYTGYVSALSAVEGFIAQLEGKE